MSDYFLHEEDEEEVVIPSMSSIDPQEESRRRRQRNLRRVLKKQGDTPSFSALLLADLNKEESGDDDDDDDDDDYGDDGDYNEMGGHAHFPKTRRPQRRILIDVDVELGLKEKPSPVPKEKLQVAPPTSNNSTLLSVSNQKSSPSTVSMPPKKRPAAVAASASSPQDEGWYEGVVSPMGFPEDAQYLSEMHCWTRQHIELFSVTDKDAKLYRCQRRSVVRGRVGVRCIHCAAAAAAAAAAASASAPTASSASSAQGDEKQSSTNDPLAQPLTVSSSSAAGPSQQQQPVMSPTAVAFPVNIKGLHAACAQKLQLHFEICPNLPMEARAQLQSLIRSKSQAQQDDSAAGVGGGRSTKRQKTGITAATYYTISAKRIGLLDAQDHDSGIRFGRDLSLEPFPMEAIRAQMEDVLDPTTGETTTVAAAAAAAAASSAPRITADEESERVLAAALMEQDDPDRLLARSADKALVTDFVFVAIRQMAICHALPTDFGARGKKTKLMKLGFAGFCCRHCVQQQSNNRFGGPDFSCRSFSSAADNMASAISNSFTSHLQKCPYVPVPVKKALTAYKRLHARQMAQLPYGSQRRLFHDLWSRLRSKDKSKEEMKSIVDAMPKPTEAPPPLLLTQVHSLATATDTTTNDALGTTNAVLPADSSAPSATPLSRPPDFPVSDDAETRAILLASEESWDPTENDNLIFPDDKYLISDYVFLTMRQVKLTMPTASDAIRIRRSSAMGSFQTPGICCLHCMDKDEVVSPSGRSFPSAPDNFSSALNSSLYNHMQACPFVHVNLKRALADLKKIHSAQCSRNFGGQRRFFNILYARLLPENAPAAESYAIATPTNQRQTLSSLGFLELPTEGRGSCQLTICSQCRMVPVQFRARGAIFTERPSMTRAREHQLNCKRNGLDLTLARDTLKAAAVELGQTLDELVQRQSFQELVSVAVGGNKDLCRTFSLDIRADNQTKQEKGEGIASNNETTEEQEDNKNSEEGTRSVELWKSFPDAVDFESVQTAFEVLASELEDCATNLRLHSELLSYLLLVAPGLAVPATSS